VKKLLEKKKRRAFLYVNNSKGATKVRTKA